MQISHVLEVSDDEHDKSDKIGVNDVQKRKVRHATQRQSK